MRWTTFSVTMIAASTSRPTAMASPPSVIVFRPTSSRLSRMPASGDRRRNRQRHDGRAADIAEQHEQHDRHEHRPKEHGATDTPQRRSHQRGLVVDDS